MPPHLGEPHPADVRQEGGSQRKAQLGLMPQLATHENPAQADGFMEAAKRIASETILHFTTPSGEKYVYHQPKFSIGTGRNVDAAEQDADLAKQLRLESGERSARDEPPSAPYVRSLATKLWRTLPARTSSPPHLGCVGFWVFAATHRSRIARHRSPRTSLRPAKLSDVSP